MDKVEDVWPSSGRVIQSTNKGWRNETRFNLEQSHISYPTTISSLLNDGKHDICLIVLATLRSFLQQRQPFRSGLRIEVEQYVEMHIHMQTGGAAGRRECKR
jgi:hypothetical protein